MNQVDASFHPRDVGENKKCIIVTAFAVERSMITCQRDKDNKTGSSEL